MANYIGKIQIGASGSLTLIGSTAYGICDTGAGYSAKVLSAPQNPTNNDSNYINSAYPSSPIIGSTIHIKFTQGNSATDNLTLQIGNGGSVRSIVGMPICDPDTVLSLTYDEYVINNDEDHPVQRWIVNDNVDTNTDTNTTYTFTGDGDGDQDPQRPSSGAYFAVTPSSGTKQYVTIAGLGAGAYQSVTGEISTNTEGALLPNVTAIKQYVAGLGLTGAMHFRGTATINIAANPTSHYPHINGYDLENNTERSNFQPEDGDVILYDNKEFVWALDSWHELGDEGSYVLNTAVDLNGTIDVPSYTNVSIDVPSIQDIAFNLTDSPGVLKITRIDTTNTTSVSATLTPSITTYNVVKPRNSNSASESP